MVLYYAQRPPHAPNRWQQAHMNSQLPLRLICIFVQLPYPSPDDAAPKAWEQLLYPRKDTQIHTEIWLYQMCGRLSS